MRAAHFFETGKNYKMAHFSKLASAAVAACLMLATPAHASNFSFTGALSSGDTVQFFDFSIGTASTVTFTTQSFAGGTQANGNVVSIGGFDPVLTVFDVATGNYIGENDDGDEPNVGIDPVLASVFDSYLEILLDAGNYTVALSQYDNETNGDLGDGFSHAGDPDFLSCSTGQFCVGDTSAEVRTNAWAIDILSVDSASVAGASVSTVPVPAALPLFGTGLAIMGFIGWRRKQKTTA